MQLKKFVTLILLSCLTACSTTDLQHQANTENSAQPQRFLLNDGLQVSLLPPDGFILTPEHYGFVQPESFSRIKVYEVEVPYKAYTGRITKDTTAESKLEWVAQKDIEVTNAICKLTLLKQAIAGTIFDKQLLICGDELSSVVVEASFPESANKMHRQAVFDSMLSLNVKTNNQLRLFTGLPFKLNETPGFKITKRFANSVVLRPIEDSVAESEESTVVISHGTTDATSIDELAINLITKGYSADNIEILTNSASKLDGIPALTTTAYATDDIGNIFWMKQTLSYQDKRFLLIQVRTLKKEKAVIEQKSDNLKNYFEFK